MAATTTLELTGADPGIPSPLEMIDAARADPTFAAWVAVDPTRASWTGTHVSGWPGPVYPPQPRFAGLSGRAPDGIVELWFDSIESIDRIFGCPAGLALMAHAGTFIGEITTTLVEVHVVVDSDPSGAHHGH